MLPLQALPGGSAHALLCSTVPLISVAWDVSSLILQSTRYTDLVLCKDIPHSKTGPINLDRPQSPGLQSKQPTHADYTEPHSVPLRGSHSKVTCAGNVADLPPYKRVRPPLSKHTCLPWEQSGDARRAASRWCWPELHDQELGWDKRLTVAPKQREIIRQNHQKSPPLGNSPLSPGQARASALAGQSGCRPRLTLLWQSHLPPPQTFLAPWPLG